MVPSVWGVSYQPVMSVARLAAMSALPMPPLPPPLPKRENVIQAFERAYVAWREQAEPSPAASYTTVPTADLVALVAKVERFAKYGANPETDALIWRLKAIVGVSQKGER